MEIIRRTACRGVLITPARELLLIQVNNPGQWIGWITPGGGLDPGESPEQGLRRELHEELGLENISLGPPIWTRFHRFEWKQKIIEQQETFFWIPAETFALGKGKLAGSEVDDFQQFRWWKLEDLGQTKEEIAPRRLHALVSQILAQGLPAQPIEIGL